MGDIAWEAKFNYYVKTKDRGIGDSTTANMTASAVQQQDKNQQSQQPVGNAIQPQAK